MGIYKRIQFGIAVAIATALGSSSLPWARVFYFDDRRPSHSAAVGTLEIELPEGHGLGTAVLVDECGILTNFHAIFGPWYVTALRPPSRNFPGTFTLTEVRLPDGSHPTARAIPVVWGDYRGPDRQIRGPHNDWAYLVLDRCLGYKYGYFSLRSLEADELEGGTDGFAAIGYSTGRQMVDPACSVHADRSAIAGKAWLHDCALAAGDSGGPIVKRGTLALVALGGSLLTDPGDPSCPTGGLQDGGAPLSRWSERCANLAVPLSWDIIDRVESAYCATRVQRALNQLGYDAGPLGAIDEPRAAEAIRQAQRDMGWAVTGEPSGALWKILWLRLPTS
jgi:hypothetical protein